MEKTEELRKIAGILGGKSSVLIFAHRNPDGDALGSAICAGLMLKSLGKRVEYAIGKDTAELYRIFEEGQLFGQVPQGEFESALIVDCSTRDFVDNEQYLEKCSSTIVIDHHISNKGYGDYVYIDKDAAATGEILYALIQI
ncbi:MAG: DHH family phosphoesterase, partial [Eubacteriaceae bacterium]|nr:DHH family phosphoesterase [Eubacteriaceae bacterium]